MELKIQGVTKKFKKFVAVDSIDGTLTPGIYGLLGPNGAGKTTLMRMICALTRPTEGKILYGNMEINGLGAEYRKVLGFLPQHFGYYPGFTVYRYLEYVASIKGLNPRYAKEKIDQLLDTYCRKLAANMNKGFEIDARVPSIMIAGGSNFPTRKKEKQNAARYKNMEDYNHIQGLLDKIRSVGTGGIRSDDPNAVEKVKEKVEKLMAEQDWMKKVNVYYRKHKTCKGFPDLSDEEAAALDDRVEKGYSWEKAGPVQILATLK